MRFVFRAKKKEFCNAEFLYTLTTDGSSVYYEIDTDAAGTVVAVLGSDYDAANIVRSLNRSRKRIIQIGIIGIVIAVFDNTTELSDNIQDIEQKVDVNKNVAEHLAAEVGRFKLT